MFRKIPFLFLAIALILSACGTLEVSIDGNVRETAPAFSNPAVSITPMTPPVQATSIPSGIASDGSDQAGWQTYQNVRYDFSVQYSPDATILIATNELATINLPTPPETSLSRKYVEIAAIQGASSCPSKYGRLQSSENITVQDLSFLHETGHGVAAGGYDWESYSTTKNEICVNLTFILHFRPDVYMTPSVEVKTFPPILSTFTWTSPPTADGTSLTWEQRDHGDYSFSYPRDLYSVREGSANLRVNWPGVIELSPNNSFNQVLSQPVSQTFRIRVAVQDNTAGWTTDDPLVFMANAGALLHYTPALIDANHPIQEYWIGNIRTFRVNDLPTGQGGPQTHIMTIYNNKIYEWLIELAQSTGDERNMPYVEAILSTFELK
jgi:hypothetical protein